MMKIYKNIAFLISIFNYWSKRFERFPAEVESLDNRSFYDVIMCLNRNLIIQMP